MRQPLNFFLLFILAFTGLGCDAPNKPFYFSKNKSALVHNLLTNGFQPLKNGIALSEIKGIGGPMNSLIPKAIANKLQNDYLPAHFIEMEQNLKDHHSSRYRLIGIARIKDKKTFNSAIENYELKIRWELLGSDKNNLLNFDQTLVVPKWKWNNGSPKLISIISTNAVKKIRKALHGKDNDRTFSVNLAPIRTKIWVATIKSTIKNGGKIIRQAIIAALRENGLEVSTKKQDSQYFLAGNFSVYPSTADYQKVKMEWIVQERTGITLGTATQNNTVPPGSFEKNWGPSAAIIAQAAISGIREIIKNKSNEGLFIKKPARALKTPPNEKLIEPEAKDKAPS